MTDDSLRQKLRSMPLRGAPAPLRARVLATAAAEKTKRSLPRTPWRFSLPAFLFRPCMAAILLLWAGICVMTFDMPHHSGVPAAATDDNSALHKVSLMLQRQREYIIALLEKMRHQEG